MVDDIEKEREREEGEKERRNLHSSRSTRFRISPTRALEDLCNLISGWERVIPLHYFIKRLNRARLRSNARFPSDSNPRSSYELDAILSKLGDKNFVAFKIIDENFYSCNWLPIEYKYFYFGRQRDFKSLKIRKILLNESSFVNIFFNTFIFNK